MIDSTELKQLEEARDKLIDRLIFTQNGDLDQLMLVINAVDDFTSAFNVDDDTAPSS